MKQIENRFTRPLFFLIGGFLAFFCFSVDSASATTYTVCASGCSFTTLTQMAASTTVNLGDTVQIQSTYASTTETFPVTFTKGVTVDCQTSGAIIGFSSSTQLSLNLIATTTLRSCTLNNISIIAQSNANDVTIFNNLKHAGNTTTIIFESAMQNLSITSNTLSGISIGAVGVTISSSTISSNTISPTSNQTSGLSLNGTISNINVTSNTFSFAVASVPADQNYTGVVLRGNNITFASNTLSFSTTPQRLNYFVYVDNAQTITVRGNYITAPGNNDSTIYGVGIFASTTTGLVTVTNNTFKCVITSPCYGLYIDDNNTNTNLSVTSTYNIAFYPSTTSTSVYGAYIAKNATSSTLNFYNDYNGIYNFTASVYNLNSNSTSTAGANTQTLNPFFMTDNAGSTDDNYLAPFSPYLDINGTLDIGAYNSTRRATIAVNPTGTIDYSTVDATSTASVAQALKSADTMTLSAGTHTAFIVSSTLAATGITINGAGASTIVSAASSVDAILLNQVNSSTISNLVLKNASSTSNAYTSTRMIFKIGSTPYDNSSALGESVPASSTLIFTAASCNNLSSNPITADGTSISTVVNNTTGDIHLALLTIGGAGNAKVTALVPNSFFSTPAALTAEGGCSGYSVTVNQWVTSTFSRSSGVLTYNSSAVSAASLTLTPYSTSPPAITRTQTNYAGIKINNGTANNFISVTSTNNNYAVWFSGTTTANVVSSSLFASSTLYDVISDTSGANNLKNVSSTIASSTITGMGSVNLYYRARVLVQSTTTTLPGVTTTFHDANNTATTTMVSGAGGLTAYSDNLLAIVMTSSSIAETAGGYNPFTVATLATSSFYATSTSQNLNSKDQTVTLTMFPVPEAAAAATTNVGGYSPPLSASVSSNTAPATPSSTRAVSTTITSTTIASSTAALSPTTSSTTRASISTTSTLPARLTVPPPAPAMLVPTASAVSSAVKPFVFPRLLSLGTVGEETSQLQVVLKNLKLLGSKTITNYFNTFTKKALQLFQKENKLSQTGALNTTTRQVLNKKITQQPLLLVPPTTIQPYRFVKTTVQGNSGEEVSMLQRKLVTLGYLKAIPNGYFGPLTKAAVVRFQKDRKIAPYPGFVGPSTRAALNKLK